MVAGDTVCVHKPWSEACREEISGYMGGSSRPSGFASSYLMSSHFLNLHASVSPSRTWEW